MITRRALRQFTELYHVAGKPLDDWYYTASRAHWQNITDVRADFPSADAVGKCTVFNIGGNKFRLIVKIRFDRQVIYVRFVLTHRVYDKGGWKNDCNR